MTSLFSLFDLYVLFEFYFTSAFGLVSTYDPINGGFPYLFFKAIYNAYNAP